MIVESCSGRDDVAVVYVARFAEDRWVEFVEAVQRPLPRERKWVLIISSLCGCPIRCLMCDAGGYWGGRLGPDEIQSQIDFLVQKRFPGGAPAVAKFKIQFARLGEPTLNPAVLEVMARLPERYPQAGMLPSLSTVAPASAGGFFSRLLEIKDALYGGGRFQLQFSIHSSDEEWRKRLMPARIWSLAEIAEYGRSFAKKGDKKVTLNFALMRDVPIEAGQLLRHFDPGVFLIKATPLNPTYKAAASGLEIAGASREEGTDAILRLRRAGFEVIHSIGDLEENLIGSNCGQSLLAHLRKRDKLADGYRYLPRKCTD